MAARTPSFALPQRARMSGLASPTVAARVRDRSEPSAATARCRAWSSSPSFRTRPRSRSASRPLSGSMCSTTVAATRSWSSRPRAVIRSPRSSRMRWPSSRTASRSIWPRACSMATRPMRSAASACPTRARPAGTAQRSASDCGSSTTSARWIGSSASLSFATTSSGAAAGAFIVTSCSSRMRAARSPGNAPRSRSDRGSRLGSGSDRAVPLHASDRRLHPQQPPGCNAKVHV